MIDAALVLLTGLATALAALGLWVAAADHIRALQSALRKAMADNLLLLREVKLARAGEREARRDFQLLAERINPKAPRP